MNYRCAETRDEGREGRKTMGCIPADTPEIEQDFCSLPFTKTCPLSWREKQLCVPTMHIVFPVSRVSRYNTLHLASKVMCQRVGAPPFGNPGEIALRSPYQQSKSSLFYIADRSLRAIQNTVECPRFCREGRRQKAL